MDWTHREVDGIEWGGVYVVFEGLSKYTGRATGVVVLQNNFEVPNALAKWVEHQGIWKIIDFRQYCTTRSLGAPPGPNF